MTICTNVKLIAEISDVLFRLTLQLESLNTMADGNNPSIIRITTELDSAADEVASVRNGGLPREIILALIPLFRRVLPTVDNDESTFTRMRVVRLIDELEMRADLTRI